jgi:AcrR family transcriptional regulator
MTVPRAPKTAATTTKARTTETRSAANRSRSAAAAPATVKAKSKATNKATAPAARGARTPGAHGRIDSRVKEAPRRTRSAATREEIIQATITCFVQIGYARTTTTEIAKVAGYTRGAVQHYFPTTEHVLKASVNYLTKSWLDGYMTAAREAPPGVDFIDYAVDTLWRFVNDRLFVAWQELVSASRTDKALRRIILPAAAKFERLRRDMAGNNFPDFAHVGRDKFDRNRDTLRFVLEGITGTILTYERDDRIAAQIAWLKEWFHSSWQHELSTNQVDRRGSV